jgi:transposase
VDILNYKFSEKEIEKLQLRRDNQPDARLKSRFIALLMLANGIEPRTISTIIGKSVKTIENWLHQYQTKGIDSLNAFQYKPKKTFLEKDQIEELVKWVKKTNPSKSKEIREYIKEQFNVKYSLEGVRVLLRKNGLKILKPKVIPGNPPSEEDQKKLLRNTKK